MAYLSPTQTGSVDQARSYLNQQAQQRRGSNLSDQEFQTLAGQVGYQGGDVTGAQVNQALDTLGWGDAGGTGVPLPASGPAPQPGTTQPQATTQAPTPEQQKTLALGGTAPLPQTTREGLDSQYLTQGQPDGGAVDPALAMSQVQNSFQTRFGRPMSEAENNLAIQYAQSLGYTGGPVPQNILDAVLAAVQTYQPEGGGPAPVEGPTPIMPGETPGQGPGAGPVERMPGEAPEPGGGTIDPNVAGQQVNDAFVAKFGSPPTAEELNQLYALVGYQQGGQVTQQMLNQALAAIQQYQRPGGGGAGGGGTGGGGQQGGGLGPGQIDPNQAGQRVQDAFLQRFGKAPSQQELNWIFQMAGYTPGGPATQEMLDKALDAIGRYTGDVNRPFSVTTPSSPAESAANALLEEILKKNFGEVDLNAPENAGRIQQNQIRSQRAYEQKRAIAAERAAQRGAIDSGGWDVDVERFGQEKGQQEEAFEADLISSELKDQRAQMMQALQLALQTGQTEKARELQEKLGTIELDLRKYLGKGQLALGLLGAQQGNQQFYDQLGLNYAQLQNLMNNQAMAALLGGG